MSLISLLIALVAEKSLSSKVWQFNYYYTLYVKAVARTGLLKSAWQSPIGLAGLVIAPSVAVYALFYLLDEALLEFILSTLVLIICFGCSAARSCYKAYLESAYRGDTEACCIHEAQIRKGRELNEQDCNGDTESSFGQTLIWLNYRYYFSVFIFFVIFGAAGAVFYRLLATIAEQRMADEIDVPIESSINANRALYIIDWVPVRIATVGYMFVGHFSKGFPIWIEYLADVDIKPKQFLGKIAKASEDYMVDSEDCTAEPCLLVKLAKRNMLLFMALTALMTLSGALV